MTGKKVYTVTLSEDGLYAVCTNIKKAYEAAQTYENLNLTYAQVCAELKRSGNATLTSKSDWGSCHVYIEQKNLNEY